MDEKENAPLRYLFIIEPLHEPTQLHEFTVYWQYFGRPFVRSPHFAMEFGHKPHAELQALIGQYVAEGKDVTLKMRFRP